MKPIKIIEKLNEAAYVSDLKNIDLDYYKKEIISYIDALLDEKDEFYEEHKDAYEYIKNNDDVLTKLATTLYQNDNLNSITDVDKFNQEVHYYIQKLLDSYEKQGLNENDFQKYNLEQYKKDPEGYESRLYDRCYKSLNGKSLEDEAKSVERKKKRFDKYRSKVSMPIKEADGQTEERLINIGLNDKKSQEIIKSVLGQLSDGIWENSPGVDKYWTFASGLDDSGNLVVYTGYEPYNVFKGYNRYNGNKEYDTKNLYSGFNDMSDDAIKKYFANKIKQIVKEEGLEWNRDNEELCQYLDRGSGVTVRDAYKVYDRLLGRVDRITESAKDIYCLWNAEAYDDVTVPEENIEYYKSLQPNMTFDKEQSSDGMWWVKMQGTLDEIKTLITKNLGWFEPEEIEELITDGIIKKVS